MRNLKGLYFGFSILFFLVGDTFAAHILEPLGTEIPATPPRFRAFTQFGHDYFRFKGRRGEERIRSRESVSPIEVEIGLGERTQLNLEWEILWEEKEVEKHEDEVERVRVSGLEEFAFGFKHRFLDETHTVPDAALLLEYAPPVGLKKTHEIGALLLASKNITPWLFVPINVGYGLENDGKRSHSLIYNFALMWRLIPDRLIPLVEFNGRRNFQELTHEIVAVPEVIWVPPLRRQVALKFGVPIGLTSDSPNWGVRTGISILW